MGALCEAGQDRFTPPTGLEAHDTPDDAGGAVCLTWPRSQSESAEWDFVVFVSRGEDGPWKETERFPSTARLRSDMPEVYGFSRDNARFHATRILRRQVFEPQEVLELRARQGRLARIQQALEAYDSGRRLGNAEKSKEAASAYEEATRESIESVDVVAEVGRLRTERRDTDREIQRLRHDHDLQTCYFRLGVARRGEAQSPEPFPGLRASGAARPNLFNRASWNAFILMLVLSTVILGFISAARRKELFLRKIAGLDAVEEALGRATEMGKPVLFVHGLTGVSDVAVIASVNILGRIARRVADYDTSLLVVNNEPVVFSLSQEVVREGFIEAGRPDRFREDQIVMVASRQFPYVAAIAGIMAREQPAANFFMGYFYAESLILAESGAITGAIQIAGTDSFTQLPFFVTTCDYTLMGEELYAASAYLSREPKLLGTLRGQDVGKAILIAMLALGTISATLGVDWIVNLFKTF